MPANVIDSLFFRDQFGTEEMRSVFDDQNLLQCWLDVEAALARAEARLGIIPIWAAEDIQRHAKAEEMELGAIKEGIDATFHPIVPLIRELQRHCDGQSGQYIHWGATTQDIMDTALVLQLRDVHSIFLRDLRELEWVLLDLCETHKETIMAGRTHGQQALPITFGYKVAVWLRENRRHIERLKACAPRLMVGQFAGAVGTLASLGEVGLEVQRLMMEDLGLGVPDIAWHTARDCLAEFVAIAGMIAGTLGKMAGEVIRLQKTEVAEVEEPFVAGKVGSSTMPHKRNPMVCDAVVGLARVIRQTVSLALETMTQEHERDMTAWQAEWEFIPRVCILTAAALRQTTYVMGGLKINAHAMKRNLDALKGLMMSEAVMMRLAKQVGRQEAHDIIYKVSMAAFEEGTSFREGLLGEPAVTDCLTETEIDELLEPNNYLGLARYFADAVCAQTRRDRVAEELH